MEGRSAFAPRTARADARPASPDGGFVRLDGEEHYRIAAYHRLDPFLMSLATDTDLWMFVASGGGLTAGRVDPDGSLFPYLTVDQLHDAHHHTGPVTLIRAARGGAAPVLWEPFSEANAEHPAVERSLSKNALGSRLVFEEVRHDLGLAFRYAWSGCDDFGWVRTATLENRRAAPVRIELLDGVRNVLPHGAPLHLYQQSSNLVDAYKKSEVDPETGLGIFSLTGSITDRAEALEVLRANTVWCHGLKDRRVHLSRRSVEAFRRGREVPAERVLNGARGNYLVTADLDLGPEASARWRLAADAGRSHVQIAALRRLLRETGDLDARIEESLRQAGGNLLRNVASADGLQASAHREATSHHFANVLFNNMRGGVFAHNHDIPVADFADFLRERNRAVARRRQPLLDRLPPTVTVEALRDAARRAGDADFERLCHEYLPLAFGRRHGDPSRPWNRFSIRDRGEDGERSLHYEGNWRDIFQNWEALCAAFPAFLPSVVAKFVNASTVDGYNPYRISRDGVDWETAAPDDPWNNIGYWGDHQIVYLLRLLESMHRRDPALLGDMLGREIFSYAEVPYIIEPYAEILRDPRTTIRFDTERAARIDARVAGTGTDGKLLTHADGSVQHVNLLEKLLVPALAKLSNLIPDAGIWMNTQRPEWNDANNVLGGGGVSVVTLCHLRRYLLFLADALDGLPPASLPVSSEVAAWLERIESVLAGEQDLLGGDGLDARDRKRLLDALGEAFSEYRDSVYSRGFTGKTDLAVPRVATLFRTALEYVEWGIRANRRDDGLYHSYNLLEFAADGTRVEIIRLDEMLEGQVAVLDSGIPDPDEVLRILEQLFASYLYRPDQHSFLLFPERTLPGFLAKNVIPADQVRAIPLLEGMLAAGDGSLVARDADGVHRFHASFRNARDVAAALDGLAESDRWAAMAARDRGAVLALFEDVFHHQTYTGRSGVMYAYEGLGCVYWHMVAKLLLAVQEVILRADGEDPPLAALAGLADMYFRIRSGFGYEKSVAEYGAFPTDPYSHTPPGGGAKQPGMTGQVKEMILARFGELGIRVEGGAVRFRPVLLEAGEFLARPAEFRYVDVAGQERMIPLPAGSLAFTLCQVPVIYERTAGEPRIRVAFADGASEERAGNTLDARSSTGLFSRSGRIARLEVGIPARESGRPSPESAARPAGSKSRDGSPS
ncbi:MAG: hypothetical protein JW819_02125 [Candidatus Krumholzibacteriota bacterium]|nr:hypothetical protein [Candidatus Krumholzibacteriota bacterium]